MLYAQKTYGRLTQNAGTVITRLVEPKPGLFTRIDKLAITVSTTQHLLTIMRPLNKTTLSAAAAASQAVVALTADPGDYPATMQQADNAIAASDYVVVQLSDGTFFVTTVSSVSSLNITLAANLPIAANSGASFWFYGIITDTNPNDVLAHARFTLPVSGTTVLGNGDGQGWYSSVRGSPLLPLVTGKFEPLILQIDNGTAASVFEYCKVVYDDREDRA